LLPELHCDYLEITATEGRNVAEHLGRFPAAPGDILIADRGYCHASGVVAQSRQRADVMVRWNPSAMPLFDSHGQRLALLSELRQLLTAGTIRAWPAWVHHQDQRRAGRLCSVRKTAQAIAAEQRRITRREQKQGWRVKPETREFAAYVMVFTTLPESAMSAAEVLEHYRFRWQIELVFKRLKSILAVGHLPKSDEQSSRAWLYGKLLVALLTQKVARLGSSFSPWGYDLGQTTPAQRVA
jgi:hypothetical protein